MNALQKHLVTYRRAHGVSQRELAIAVGVTTAAIANIEQGLSLPSYNLLVRLAHAMGVECPLLCRPDDLTDMARRRKMPAKGTP